VKNVKAVFFDAGGTLFCPYPSVGEIYAHAAKKYGVTYDPETLQREFEDAWARRAGLSSLGPDTNHEKERAWWHSLVGEVFTHKRGQATKKTETVPFSEFDAFFSELHESFTDHKLWQIYPEVGPVLAQLRARGLKLGIVSNWDLRLPVVVKNLKLWDSFDFVLGSSACGATKPARKIFEEALSLAGVLPHEAVHVGDTYDEDFVGAKEAGLHAVHLDREGVGKAVPGDPTISCLKELMLLE
jgi:putative hydrolase of the HAD superfamily